MPAGETNATHTGATGGLCTISTSDTVGLIDNLLVRMQNLERVLELLTGMNISTSSIDQISANLGTMTNATIINAARGWTTAGTFTGVAISTLGWTMSDGCSFPIVTVDEEGVLQFGLSDCGEVVGAGPELWSNSKSATLWTNSIVATGEVGPNIITANFEIYDDQTNLVVLANGGDNFYVTTTGWYSLDITAEFSFTSTASKTLYLQWSTGANALTVPHNGQFAEGPGISVITHNTGGGSSGTASTSSCKTIWLETGAMNTIQFHIPVNVTAGCSAVLANLRLLKTTRPSSAD